MRTKKQPRPARPSKRKAARREKTTTASALRATPSRVPRRGGDEEE